MDNNQSIIPAVHASHNLEPVVLDYQEFRETVYDYIDRAGVACVYHAASPCRDIDLQGFILSPRLLTTEEIDQLVLEDYVRWLELEEMTPAEILEALDSSKEEIERIAHKIGVKLPPNWE